MAGLAVVASDLPGLRRVIETSRGGLLYKPGDPASLAECIAQLREDRKLLQTLRANARSYALSMGNCESQMDLFAIKVRQLFGSTLA
jgi:glycosyltransferase involved in cell wall biosynthesis